LHAAVARHFAGALAPERIAAYWWAAGQVQPALAAVREAVEQDCTVGLQAAALALLDESEAQLGRLGVDDEAAHAHLRALRARVHLQLADLEQALACARAVLRSPAQPADRGVAWCTIAAVALQRGQLHECERALREAQLADPEADELPMEWAKLAHLQGRAHVAVQLLQARVERLRRQPPGRALIAALTSLGAAHDDQGDVACGVPLHQEAYRLARALGARYAQVDVANNLLWALSSLGRDEEGIAIAREALALGEYDGTPYLRNNLAYSLKRLGRLEEARDETEAVERCQDATLALIARARLVELYALLGDAPRSARMAERVLATLATTEVPLAHYCAATYLARHGTEAQLRAVLAHLRPASIDPWMRDDFIAALSARNVDPAPYLVDAPPAAALTVR
jgi:tetratricopeptide (TPR) repeat protein